ncbi:hypothetical protein CALCODRAFT_222677 [Calocera cornea HHB12733]|uniref:Uncharacterized protein n=1 Tax=Calocera cornea HHB12733 TaxID=1353952 RepID=A0A165H540_9BASI|nr:hypothetical protein CALCODRAFT_222677 [Calocera cornea HHB12733]
MRAMSADAPRISAQPPAVVHFHFHFRFHFRFPVLSPFLSLFLSCMFAFARARLLSGAWAAAAQLSELAAASVVSAARARSGQGRLRGRRGRCQRSARSRASTCLRYPSDSQDSVCRSSKARAQPSPDPKEKRKKANQPGNFRSVRPEGRKYQLAAGPAPSPTAQCMSLKTHHAPRPSFRAGLPPPLRVQNVFIAKTT